MDITYDILPEPLYHPLTPSVESLVDYATELFEEESNITFEWATNEIGNHSLSYVRLGLVADAVRRYKVYLHPRNADQKCRTFSEYCQKFIGKSAWYVNKIIDAAKVAYELIKLGFNSSQLPDCEYQARPLVKAYKSAEKDWIEHYKTKQEDMDWEKESPVNPLQIIKNKWQQVIDSAPRHCLTANKISEIVEDNPQPPAKQKVHVRTATKEKWERLAREAGMTPDDYLEALLDGKIGNNLDTGEIEQPSPEQEEKWLKDVEKLVEQEPAGQNLSGDGARAISIGNSYWQAGNQVSRGVASEIPSRRKTEARTH